MPAVKQIHTPEYQILVWKLEEDIDFFSQQVNLSLEESQEYAFIHSSNRKFEWMATRFVQRQVVSDYLIKDDNGKPFLKSQKGYISLSHCKNYAVAAFSKQHEIGVDIEPVNDKILRIADKFMSEREFSFIEKKAESTHLIACWCIKEAIYKSYGKKKVNFKEQIQIHDFKLNDDYAKVSLVLENEILEKKVYLDYFEDLVLAYL